MTKLLVRSLHVAAAALLTACGNPGSPPAEPQPGDAPVAAALGARPVEVVAHPDPLAALDSADPTLAANKRLVFDFWRSVVNAGRVEVADELLLEGYIQHSPVLRTGRTAFKEIFSVVPRREIPELVEPPLVASLAEGDLVVMALLERMPAREGAAAYTTTHFNLFRIENGRLAEHWHSVQTAPGPNVPLPEDGGPQPVTGALGAAQLALLESADPHLAANKRLAFDAWREIVEAGRGDLVARYFDPNFVEHNPQAASGPDGFRASFAARAARPVEASMRAPVVAVVAENDLVALVTMQEHPHPSRAGRTYTTTWFDLLRIVDGRLAEHWDGTAGMDAPAAAP
jgi:predicted SnoaL-like aldol condensation-catalyzing enzyme